jgi:hypothetical protein
MTTIGNILANPAGVTTGIVVITNVVSAGARQRLNIYKTGGSAVVSADNVYITVFFMGT